jgi:hypothetical protein
MALSAVCGWAHWTSSSASQLLEFETLGRLPEPMSNNAVALAVGESGPRLVSVFGLEGGSTWRDLSSSAWVYLVGEGAWQRLPDPPGATGRLAAGASAAAGSVWVFGGYTVASDGAEVSTPEVFRLDPVTGVSELATRMPVPVDDMVVLAHEDRYIYLVSGWHDLGNVNLVQVLDTVDLSWAQATPWPGAPVFGHAGGMSAGKMVICDGVRTEYPPSGDQRRFVASDECWLGTVDAGNHREIKWQPLPSHPGRPRYRMAGGADASGRIVFAGGADNPYNFNGQGYNGVPAEPFREVFWFDLESGAWSYNSTLPMASMDHRGLPFHAGWFYLIGGMDHERQLADRVLRFRIGAPAPSAD